MNQWIDLILECECLSMDVVADMQPIASLLVENSAEVAALSNYDASTPWYVGDELLGVIGFNKTDRVPGEITRLFVLASASAVLPVLKRCENPWALRNPRAFYGGKIIAKAKRLTAKSYIVLAMREKKAIVFAQAKLLRQVALHALESCSFDKAHRAAYEAMVK